MKKINQIIFASILFTVISVGLTFYIIKINRSINSNSETYSPKPFCGTNAFLTENEKRGKDIFNSNCAACHHKNRVSTGPILKKENLLIFKKWLAIKKPIDSSKISKLREEYHNVMWSKTLTEKEIYLLIDYCESK